jgi:hypothetical protein
VLLWVVGASLAVAGAGPIGGFLLLALPITATICGFLALREHPAAGRGLAIAGIVLGLTQLGLYAIFLLFVLVAMLACGRAASETTRPCCSCETSNHATTTTSAGTTTTHSSGTCCDPCTQGCSSCGHGCDACGSGCSSCGSGCGSGCSCAIPGVMLVAVSPARPPLRARLEAATAHHPDLPRYEADVYRLLGVRLCVGCFTTYPTFLVASVVLAVLRPAAPWLALLAAGLALAALQAVSSLGWARWRWLKMAVKSALGAGLALAVHAVLVADLPDLAQAALLAGMLGLALLSTLPRRLRMLHASAESKSIR